MTKCEWCFRFKDDCKEVQIIKWKKQGWRKGKRQVCLECRKLLKGEYNLVRK